MRKKPSPPYGLCLIAILAALCGATAAAEQPETGFTVLPEAELPEAAAPIDRGFCGHHEVAPQTPAGRTVAEAGWAVISEEPLGPLIAVSFVAGFRSMTSGACVLAGGRIGFFGGVELLALVEARPPDGTGTGRLRRVGPDRLRIWSGEMLPRPVADIILTEGAPMIVPLARTDAFCDGSLKMPLIHGLSLSDASALLAAHGWEPDPVAQPSDPLAARLAARGFTGAEHCSGTGFGFCSLTFVQGGATASVLTFGNVERPAGPDVADYVVTCPDSPSHPR